jgi:two-component system, oxyanion-binding sensor
MNSTPINIGFVPLIDCAPLAAAADKGFAAAEGLALSLVRENSWANIRDRLIVGHFDAAHMLGPMTVASTLGIGHITVPIIAPLALGVGGNAITVSSNLWNAMMRHGARPGAGPSIQGRALRQVVAERERIGAPSLTLATVYPFSCHNYLLRYWLSACGIDPDRDVLLIVNPPSLMVDAMRADRIDGFCAGEPWNSLAVAAGTGHIAATTSAIWRSSPEKVLGLRADWADAHPRELHALVRAVYRAALWCEHPAHHAELAQLLAQSHYLGVPAEVLELALSNRLVLTPGNAAVEVPEFLAFASHAATFPWTSDALWFYSQMVRWKQIDASPQRAELARSSYRPDLYREALRPLGVAAPPMDFRSARRTGDKLADDADSGFFDQRMFDPNDLAAYIAAS